MTSDATPQRARRGDHHGSSRVRRGHARTRQRRNRPATCGDHGTDPAHRPLVGPAAGDGSGAGAVHRLLDAPRLPERLLLRRALHLAVLLPVHHDGMRGQHLPEAVHGALLDLPGDLHPRLPAGFPADLLLLPQGVLPVVLAVATGMRGRGAPSPVHRGSPVPPAGPEPAPLLLLRRPALQRHPDLRRRPRLPRRAGQVGAHGTGHPRAPRECGPAVAVLTLVPLLPAHRRRPAELVLPPSAALPLLDGGVEAERQPHEVRVGVPLRRGVRRFLRLPAGHRHDRRPEVLLMELERHEYDVVVIGAGGAGLRGAIAAHETGARTAVVCKSLLGKAHTVMAEGGIAAAMANAYPEDNWRVHFRDTMRGGKMLNHWRMAQLHAQEAPDRVRELEDWGALFDRTPDGLISQRDFGGNRYARIAHVGDRTGLEMIRTLQQRAVELGIDVFMECTVTELFKDDAGAISGAFGYWRETGTFIAFEAPSVVLATGGIGKSFKVTSNSWEYTGDGHALALRACAALINMEFVQFHPTGMVWPRSVKGLLVTESVRGDGGILKNSEGKRFMFDYIPEFFKSETADTVEEADRWYDDKKKNRRPPELPPRDEVARAINSEIKAGRGTPHGGIYLDIASRRTPEFIKKRLPSMYHQFKELADVDITQEPMEIGPTCHYVMGGVEVDPDTELSAIDGLYAVGECSGGMHGSNRLGGNSLSDLIVFGKRAGEAAAAYASGLSERSSIEGDLAAAEEAALAPVGG